MFGSSAAEENERALKKRSFGQKRSFAEQGRGNSSFTVTKLNIGSDAVTWTKDEVIVYIYEKTETCATFTCDCGAENPIVHDGKLNNACRECSRITRLTGMREAAKFDNRKLRKTLQ